MNDPAPNGQAPDSQALPAGTRLEEFMIERVLGSGGFGITYLAKDTSLGRQVVIKENLPSQFVWRETATGTVRPRHSTGGDADDFEWSRRNFLREAETLASMDHPGIVRVLRKFEANGTAYFVMPFVQGVEFGSLIARRAEKGQPFTEDELRGLTKRMLDALGYLHDRGIYHRDIKPANILITTESVPVLMDFGSARQRLSERSMTVIESAGYTPFEQLQSRGQVGPWSDLYALAATIAKAITFETPPKAADRMMGDPWTGLAGDPNYAAVYSQRFLLALDRAMAVDPRGRWQNAGEWLTELRSEHSRQPAAALAPRLPAAASSTETAAASSLQGAAAQPTPSPPPALPPSRALAWLTGLAAGCAAMVRSSGAWVCSTARAPSFQEIAPQSTPLPPPALPPSPGRADSSNELMKRVRWLVVGCLLLGLVVWGLVTSNQTWETEQRAAQAEQQRLSELAKAKEEAARQAAEQQRSAELAKAKEAAAKQADEQQRLAELAKAKEAAAKQAAEQQRLVEQAKAKDEAAKQAAEQQRLAELARAKEAAAQVAEQQRLAALAKAKAAKDLEVASKETPFVNSLGMRLVPAGTPGVLFCVWETRVKDFRAFVDATGHDAIQDGPNGAPAYTLEKDEAGVTWKQAGGTWQDPRFPPGHGQDPLHPVVCVSSLDAEAFCAWLTKHDSDQLPSGWRYRLPTDAEWSAACGPAEFPWGESFPPGRTDGNYSGIEAMVGPKQGLADDFSKAGRTDGWARTAPVGSFTQNRYGLFDMGGNACEWCATWYQASLNTAETLAAIPEFKNDGGQTARVVRGSSWDFDARVLMRSAYRFSGAPRYRCDSYGFRVVLVGGGD